MDNFRIESLQINEIGPFQYLKIDFPVKKDPDKAEIHILTGENGTGKSTILEVLIYASALKQDNSNIYKKTWNAKYSFIIEDSEKGLFKFPASQSQFQELSIRMRKYLLDEELERDIVFFAYAGYRRVANIKITGVQEMLDFPLDKANDFTNSINPQNLIQWLVNIQTRELIVKGKGDTAKAKQYRSTIEIIENALGEIIESEVKFDLEEEPLGIKIKVDGQSLNFDQLPDGLKSMVSWMGDLLMRMDRLKWVNNTPVLERNFILLLDEIEVHLHPAWQRKILPVVQKLFKNAQIFISTHSPFVVGSVDGAWVHRFIKKDGYSVLAGEPILSEDAKSYDYILEEIFGVKERFGVDVERKLAEFQSLKKEILKNPETAVPVRFRKLIGELMNQNSVEIESIIGMELRQLKRLTNQDFSVAEI
ncbi:AAA family ATPase [Runella sp.]|uniref:AAA family ATPase n=1 Tax=Runella sp. TaxID=1960881 RepID=UPI003D0FBD02